MSSVLFGWKSASMALFLFLLPAVTSQADSLPTEELTIVTGDGRKQAFVVEVASSEIQRENGLMNRQSMPKDHGMLFDFGDTRPVYMWMRNTYIPLDMLFITAEGKIVHIKADTLPLSDDIISSQEPVRFALELNAGQSSSRQIAEGAFVKSKTIESAIKKQ